MKDCVVKDMESKIEAVQDALFALEKAGSKLTKALEAIGKEADNCAWGVKATEAQAGSLGIEMAIRKFHADIYCDLAQLDEGMGDFMAQRR